MRPLLSGLMLFSLASTPCLAQQSLVGTYRLVSLVSEIDGEPPRQTLGVLPAGMQF